MSRTDMSSRAVTLRLLRTEQLRRLCLALRRRPRGREAEGAPTEKPARGQRGAGNAATDPSSR